VLCRRHELVFRWLTHDREASRTVNQINAFQCPCNCLSLNVATKFSTTIGLWWLNASLASRFFM
jgi:hypothetical protein